MDGSSTISALEKWLKMRLNSDLGQLDKGLDKKEGCKISCGVMEINFLRLEIVM
jgi:hypothetical protein